MKQTHTFPLAGKQADKSIIQIPDTDADPDTSQLMRAHHQFANFFIFALMRENNIERRRSQRKSLSIIHAPATRRHVTQHGVVRIAQKNISKCT